MATVFIPALLRDLTGGLDRVEVPGATVRQVVNALEERYPGMRARLVADDALSPRVAVAVDGHVTRLGLLEKVGERSEVHFLPAISGGAPGRREEIVHLESEDGLPLAGAVIAPADRPARPTAVVFVHGLTGTFYGRTPVGLGRALAERGYVCLAGNNRGHDFGWALGQPGGEYRFYGGAWERFDESPLDVAAWIGLAEARGFARVVLFGHSLGALKVAYYQALRQDPRVVALVAGSPPLRPALPRPELLAAAERMVAAGRGRDLMPWGSHQAGGGTVSAETYLNRARHVDVFGAAAASPLIGRVRCPLLAFYGDAEPRVGGEADLQLIRRNAPNARRVDTRIFPGADHSYIGHEAAIAGTIAEWIDVVGG